METKMRCRGKKRFFSYVNILLTFLLAAMLFVPRISYAEPIINPANGHYYDIQCINSGGLNWYEARDTALNISFEGLQGHLATITSQEEETFLIDKFSTIGGPNIWLGGTDESSEGNWKWITGEPWGYTNWDTDNGEPNGGTEENCLEYTDGEEKWNDESCTTQRNCFLVEFEAVKPVAPVVHSVPTMNTWGMIAFVLMIGAGSVHYIRKKRSV